MFIDEPARHVKIECMPAGSPSGIYETGASSARGLVSKFAAFDGQPKTFWLAPGFGPEWIVRDLRKTVKLKGIRTSFFEERRFISTRYTIETSLDGQTWSVIVPEKDIAEGKAEDTLSAPVEARYIRTTVISNTSISGPEWLGMSEQNLDIAEE